MEFHKKDAIYLQIADIICEKILIRQWREGEKIPSVRDMAVSIEVNPNTVMRAYAHLQDKEIIFNKRGIGYFVADNAYQTTRILMKSNFVRNDLPRVFNTMELLDMDLDELADLFKRYGENDS
jgi:DNA-binding transcriptional regulator YhcF (GntR family)